jgi:DNA-directed RNA polymerase III subunit RPC2
MALEDAEMDDEWEQPNRTQWRGLGLTDPVKNVEASQAHVPHAQ